MVTKIKTEEQMMLDGVKRPVGRPRKPDAMTAAQRQAKRRAKQKAMIESGDPSRWDRAICLVVLGNDKYALQHEAAYRRLGELMGIAFAEIQDQTLASEQSEVSIDDLAGLEKLDRTRLRSLGIDTLDELRAADDADVLGLLGVYGLERVKIAREGIVASDEEAIVEG